MKERKTAVRKEFQKEELKVKIFETRDEMGRHAAKDIAACIKELLKKRAEINMIFAAAPSQNDVLHHLCVRSDIQWEKINAFHMDEYIGLPDDAPQGFANFLKERIFLKKPFKSIHLINCSANDPELESDRYGKLLEQYPTDIVCMGIGENGHIAFNDPHVADFHDKKVVKPVKLDEVCRMQQVNDGCFQTIEEVPQYALTLTIPTLIHAPYLFCVVPCATKAQAVKNTVEGEINECCPASILRTQKGSTLYCDKNSAALLDE